MGANSHIAWCDHTFNPWMGCSKVSPGCQNCYAEAWAKRSGLVEWGPGKPRRRTSAAKWREPVKWNSMAGGQLAAWEGAKESWKVSDTELVERGFLMPRRPRVFCGSLMDWLDPEIDIRWKRDLVKLIHRCRNLDWLLLTKRPHLFDSMMGDVSQLKLDENDAYGPCFEMIERWVGGDPPAHVWIGASAEDQQRADERINDLLDIPARVRFLSCEPLLGEISFDDHFGGVSESDGERNGVHWVIVGGESGPNRRSLYLPDMAGIIEQCKAAGVPIFVKQDSGPKPGMRGTIPNEWWGLKEFPE